MDTIGQLVAKVEAGDAARVELLKRLGGGGSLADDVPPDTGKKARGASVKAAKSAEKKATKAPKARAPRGGSNAATVGADIKLNPGTGVGDIIRRTGLARAQVTSVLQALKKKGDVDGQGGKRDMKYTWTGASEG